MDDSRPIWDEGFARELVGSQVIVGMTYNDPDGPRQEQFYGSVIAADPTGITLLLDGRRAGETHYLPPDPGAFQPAPPGSYRLRSTGEVVEDPDYLCAWTIDPPVH